MKNRVNDRCCDINFVVLVHLVEDLICPFTCSTHAYLLIAIDPNDLDPQESCD